MRIIPCGPQKRGHFMNFRVVSFVQTLLSGKGSFSASWQFCCLLPGCPAHFVIHLVVFNTCSGNLCLQVRSWDFICNVQLNLKCFQNIRFWTSEFYKHRLRVLRVRIIQSRKKKITRSCLWGQQFMFFVSSSFIHFTWIQHCSVFNLEYSF